MKKLSKNPIDQYFRENLGSPDLEYNKQDWKGLEEMLPKNQKKNGDIREMRDAECGMRN